MSRSAARRLSRPPQLDAKGNPIFANKKDDDDDESKSDRPPMASAVINTAFAQSRA